MNVTLYVPEYVLKILKKLEGNGYEAFLVGGCVRDSLLSKRSHDYDIATNAIPADIKRLFSKTLSIGEKFGMVAVVTKGGVVEVTTYRKDGDYLDGRHPEEVLPASSLKEDCQRRDFTVNAMAYSPQNGFLDYFGGLEDLASKLIRTVGVPNDRFSEDALRILRAYRFSAQLGFHIEPKTREAAKNLAGRLQLVSAERKREELLKILNGPEPEKAYTVLEDGILPYEAQPQSLLVLPKRLRLGRFYLSMEVISQSRFLADMKFSNATKKWLRDLKMLSACPPEATTVSLRRFIAEYDEKTLSDYADLVRPPLKKLLRQIKASGAPLCLADLAVSGNDLLELGIADGREIGRLLKALLGECIENPELNSKEKLIERIQRLR